MRKTFLLLLLCLTVFSLSALAEEWSKTYQVGDKPSLRVETNDASVEVTRGVDRPEGPVREHLHGRGGYAWVRPQKPRGAIIAAV